MADLSEDLLLYKNEISEAKDDVKVILNLAEYDLDSLKEIDNPNILVLGTGPHLPEAVILRDWSEENKKVINVTCIDKLDIDDNYLKKLVNIQSSEYFKMKFIKTDFEDFNFDKYDLIFLLRFSNFSLIDDSVFNNIVTSMKDNSTFIMSGGLNSNFSGYSLQNSGISLKLNKEVPYSDTDFFGCYGGSNRVLKFSKISNAI